LLLITEIVKALANADFKEHFINLKIDPICNTLRN